MSLVYRAIWQDEPDGIHDRALDAFRWWVAKRSSGARSFGVGATETIDGTTTLVQFGAGDDGSIQRCSLHVDDGTDRETTTLITTGSDRGGSIWVDLEYVTHRTFSTYRVKAPPLSTQLISTGIKPRRGPVPLAVKPRALHPEEIPGFSALLGDSRRDLPVLVMTSGPDLNPKMCLAAGEHAAQVAAGSAAVYLIGQAGRVNLTEILGPELGMKEGTARLYLPAVSPEEPNPARHHALSADRVTRDPKAVPHTFLQVLAPATAARRPPEEYATLRRLLQVDIDTIQAENTKLEARVHDLESQLADAEDQGLELVADLEASEGRVNLLQAALAQMEPGAASRAPTTETTPPDVDSLVAAAHAAQRHLHGIVLPDAACRDLEELDQRIESGAWGRTAWRGLLALDAFARDESYKPGFWLWCQANRSPFAWPATAKKLAMRESDTVMAKESLASKRQFPVDEAVSSDGRIQMQAHLKIAEGGNHQIPRIYFYDDRHGKTGKIHIGFFGPHRYVPNTLT